MLRVIVCALAFSLIAVGDRGWAGDQQPRGKPPSTAQQTAATPKEVQIGEFIIGPPIQCKNLTVFPVLSKTPKNEDRYITLEEGLASGKVQVYEVGAEVPAAPTAEPGSSSSQQANQPPRPPARQPQSRPRPQPNRLAVQAIDSLNGMSEGTPESADVNHLMVLNRSDRPLYLMPGEVIYGGQQDRCVGQECIVPAGDKPVKVEVFCVEHGRWFSRPQGETHSALGQLNQSGGQNMDENARRKLAEDAKKGKFVAPAGSLTKAARAAVQEGKGQQEVWDKVGEANAATGALSLSGTFTANYTSPQVLKQIEGYVKELEKPVADQVQVVGAMMAVSGKIESVDVFNSTPLFKKVWPKLLKSHALDAAAASHQKKHDKVAKAVKTATLEDAEKFFRTAMQADVRQRKVAAGGLVVTKRETKEVVSYSTSEKGAAAAGGMGGMGFGGGVHSSGYSK